MRDAYILTLRAPVQPDDGAPVERATALLRAAIDQGPIEEKTIEHLTVSGARGAARTLGLAAGLLPGVAAEEAGAPGGSGLLALASAVRAVTSGFESVAAALAVEDRRPPAAWPDGLTDSYSKVPSAKQRQWALARAGLSWDDVLEAVDARREAFTESGGALLPLNDSLPAEVSGAGVVLLAGHREIREHGWPTRARVTSVAHTGLDPAHGPSAAVAATEAVLHRLQLRPDELGLVQVDAPSPHAPALVAQTLGLPAAIVNTAGDALCDGRIPGVQGVRELERLLDALDAADRRFGLVVGVEPEGAATAVVVDRAFFL